MQEDEFPFKAMGIRLKIMREFLGFKADVFAESIGLGRTSYYGNEQGRSRFSVNSAMKVRALYRVPLDFTLCGDVSILNHEFRDFVLQHPKVKEVDGVVEGITSDGHRAAANKP